ncbi:MAG: LytR/AlgR family response regulator transcription factor [Bacteroidales bacterium]
MIKAYIHQPYPLTESKWKLPIFISLFVALFMIVFQPFGLVNLHHSYKVFLLAGYGGICLIILMINLLISSFFLKKWFNPASWTLIKQILWLSWTLLSIGTGNYLYSAVLFSFWSWHGFIVFQVYTLAVGIIPIVVLTIMRKNYSLSQNLKSANEFNAGIHHNKDELSKQKLCFVADNNKDKFEIELSDLLYIESCGNYIEIFYEVNNQLKNNILRSTLKRTELQLENNTAIVKCHRAFLVNIHKIIQVKGNSQGLKLVLKHTEIEIPVSRNFSKKLKNQMQTYK